MADWADISNLWWLRPQRSDEGNSLLAGVQVGAQLRQQKLSNELAFKRLALENQYRQDSLKYQNRRVDALIDSYDDKAQHQMNLQEDAIAVNRWRTARAEGREIPVTVSTIEGMRALETARNEFAHSEVLQRGTAEMQNNNLKLTNMAYDVIRNAKVDGVPTNDSIIASEILKATNGGTQWDTGARSQIEEMYHKWYKPPPGLVPTSSTIRTTSGSTTFGPAPGQEPTSIQKDLDAAQKLEDDAAKLSELGREDEATKLLDKATMLKAAHVKQGQQITMTTPSGETISVSSGGQGGLTTPVQTQTQQRMIAGEKLAWMGSKLSNELAAKAVGVPGAINQLWNELATQLPGFEGQYVEGVTDFKTLLGMFNENAIKAISSDPRISDRDVKRLMSVLPRPGVMESQKTFQDKIKTFTENVREMARSDATALKQPVPEWAMTKEEIASKVKAGEMTRDHAIELLTKYH